jgi:hypothetical protein
MIEELSDLVNGKRIAKIIQNYGEGKLLIELDDGTQIKMESGDKEITIEYTVTISKKWVV